MKKSFIKTIISLSIILSTGMTVYAATPAEDALNMALTQKTSFYYFNMAYNEIMKIQDPIMQGEMLAKLSYISNDVWTDDVKRFNTLLDEMVKTKSGRIYDQIERELRQNTNLIPEDRDYLLGELTSWGRDWVWTPEYINAVDAVVDLWNKPSYDNYLRVKDIVNKQSNSYNREYLLEEVENAKVRYNISEPSDIGVTSPITSIKEIYKVKNDTSLTNTDKIEAIVDIMKENPKVTEKTPQNSLDSESGKAALDILFIDHKNYLIKDYSDIKSEEDLDSMVKDFNYFFVKEEIKKYQHGVDMAEISVFKPSVKINRNMTGQDVDITDIVLAKTGKVNPDITLVWNKINDLNNVRDIYYKDGRIYLRPNTEDTKQHISITFDVSTPNIFIEGLLYFEIEFLQ